VMILFQSGTTALHGTTAPHGTIPHHGTIVHHGTTTQPTMITGTQIMKLKNTNQALQLLESALIRPKLLELLLLVNNTLEANQLNKLDKL